MFLHHHMKSSHWATVTWSNSRGSQVGDPQQLGLALRIGHRRAVSARQVRGPRLVCALDALDAKVEMGWLMLDICFFNGRNIWKNQLFFLVHTSCNRNYGGMIWIWKQWRWGCKNHGSRWLTNEIRLIWSHLFFPVFWALKPIRTIARSSNYLPLLSITLIGEPCLLMLVAFIILNPEFCCWKIPTFADSRLWSIRVGFNCCDQGIPHEGHGSTGRLGNRRHSQAAGHLKPRHIWHFHGSFINFHGIWCCEICWSIYFFYRSNGDLKRKGWANDAWIRARALTKSLWTMSGCNAAAVQRLFGPPSPSRPVENWWKSHSWNPNMTRCKPLLSGKSM